MEITVNTLLQLCMEQVKAGNGNKKIFISQDDEGNGFHGLYYGFTSDKADIKPYDDDGLIRRYKNSLEDIVLLG